MRFLDMKHFGNHKIYNKQVFGILYKNALRDIRYRYGQETSDTIGDLLRSAFNSNNDDI
jgi:hypothetical protein